MKGMIALTEKYIKHFSSLFGIDFNIYDLTRKDFLDFKNTFCSLCPNKCDYKTTHLYGTYESIRWDNKYIYYCPMEFLFIATPLFGEFDIPTGSVIAGPLLIGNIDDFEETHGLPHMETHKVNDLAEIISKVFSENVTNEYKESTTDFLNTVYKELDTIPNNDLYPIELESALRRAITSGDSKTSKELLNRILGEIFFHSNADFDIIKARAFELMVLLSSSAIEGGADSKEILNLNNSFIKEIDSIESLEKLSFSLSNVINRFVSYVFEFGDIKHSDTMLKIASYVKNNYMNRITLEDISEHVYMSKSYVSKIFKEEMKISLSSYINKVRIDKASQLLLNQSLSIADVANLTGFDDQSYFTKQFKLVLGLSPKKYREKHGL